MPANVNANCPCFQDFAAIGAGGGTPSNIYLRPGGVDNYFRPDGTSYYIRP